MFNRVFTIPLIFFYFSSYLFSSGMQTPPNRKQQQQKKENDDEEEVFLVENKKIKRIAKCLEEILSSINNSREGREWSKLNANGMSLERLPLFCYHRFVYNSFIFFVLSSFFNGKTRLFDFTDSYYFSFYFYYCVCSYYLFFIPLSLFYVFFIFFIYNHRGYFLFVFSYAFIQNFFFHWLF